MVANNRDQPSSHQRITSARVAPEFISNSWSRLRSGFSPSVVRKSVKRERMLPAICLTMMCDRIRFGIERYEQLFVFELSDGALGKAFVPAELAADFFKIMRGNVGHAFESSRDLVKRTDSSCWIRFECTKILHQP